MDITFIYDELIEAYKSDDVEKFNQINSQFNLGLESIKDVEKVENRPTIDLSHYYVDAQYMKNYTTSRRIMDFEPVNKHDLDSQNFKITSYSWVIFHVLTELQTNPHLDVVLNHTELNMPDNVAKDFLISKGLIQPKHFDKEILKMMYESFTVEELKDELRQHSLKVSGRKRDLIQRLIEFNGLDNPNAGEFIITDYGQMRLRGVNWVRLYETCLEYFDFDDFEDYMKRYDTGNVVQNSFNYVDEHIELAYEINDFDRLHDALSSKALLFIQEEDFEKSLKEELKIFILDLNPVYLKDLKNHYVIEYSNLSNIGLLMDLSEIDEVKDIFNESWNEMELDETIIPEDDCLNYLNKLLDGAVIDNMIEDIKTSYY